MTSPDRERVDLLASLERIGRVLDIPVDVIDAMGNLVGRANHSSVDAALAFYLARLGERVINPPAPVVDGGEVSRKEIRITFPDQARNDLFERVDRERQKRDAQWGGADHDDGLSNGFWLGILTEKLGEIGREVQCQEDRDDADYYSGSLEKYLVQMAAVCIAWLEVHARMEKGADR